MTDKSLPEIYREAADLVLSVGKIEGDYRALNTDLTPCGYCTMGAAFEVAGLMPAPGEGTNLLLPAEYISETHPEFMRYAKPISDQLVVSGRKRIPGEWYEDGTTPGQMVFLNIYHWNDGGLQGTPSAEDVAKLLRETADAVEKESAEK